jgi:hypothetical protein
MKTLLSVLFIGLAACNETNDSLTGRGTRDEPQNEPGAAPELQCNVKAPGKSYALFDGKKLDESRANQAASINRARIKPYAVMAGEYRRVLGLVPKSLANASASFDDPPDRWYAEANHSGISLNALHDISFEGCLAYAKTNLETAPTDESAAAECTKLMRKAWSRSPSPAEIGACTDLAMKKLSAQSDPPRRWAYVCASILSSSQFVSF